MASTVWFTLRARGEKEEPKTTPLEIVLMVLGTIAFLYLFWPASKHAD